jgi:hypothetical protein
MVTRNWAGARTCHQPLGSWSAVSGLSGRTSPSRKVCWEISAMIFEMLRTLNYVGPFSIELWHERCELSRKQHARRQPNSALWQRWGDKLVNMLYSVQEAEELVKYIARQGAWGECWDYSTFSGNKTVENTQLHTFSFSCTLVLYFVVYIPHW